MHAIVQATKAASSSGAAGASACGWHHQVHSSDIDAFAAAQREWSLRYEQLSAGRFAGELEHVQLPGLRLVHERTSCAVRQRGLLGTGHVGIAMPLGLSGHATFNGQPLSGESIMVGRSEALDLCLPAGARTVGIVVELNLLDALWRQLYQKPLSRWIERQLVVQARPTLAGALHTVHLKAMREVAAVPALLHDERTALQLRDAVLIEWIEALPAQVRTDELGGGEARKRVVDRACEAMLASPEAPLSILEVCRRIGVSPRKLEYCFRDVLGIAPARYLRAARLGALRRELLRQPGAAVQDVAARCGFWHMGELAAAYRQQFGELPSETARRRA
ncbi:MAG: HTH-type transcriptional activator RhaR [Burkholderiaceae bacterium]|nr:HTH-type transcriptional activator RhaR [Burkholderiaceae bacterium]